MEMEIDGQLITLNEQQEAAVTDMLHWFDSSPTKPYILQGYAGTGKTTLLKILINSLKVNVNQIALVAPTNRAAKVLSNKTGLYTKTAFSLIYTTTREELDWERSRLRIWQECVSLAQLGVLMVEHSGIDLEKEYYSECESVGTLPTEQGLEDFVEGRKRILLEYEGITLPDDAKDRQELFEKLKTQRMRDHRQEITALLEEDLPIRKKDPAELTKQYKVILCDEASMINDTTGKDLLACEIPTILVGDPFQLPPVKAKAYWDKKRPDAVLTKIERQKGVGAGIPIVGEQIRNGKPIKANDSLTIHRRNSLSKPEWVAADQILCGTHKTRERMCSFMRDNLGFDSDYPQAGEKVVAVYNDRAAGIMNGELYEVLESQQVRNNTVTKMTLRDPYGKEIPNVYAWSKGFSGRSATNYLDDEYGKFWFGYAITCHQSQGSEWENVIVCDDWPGEDSRDRWLYTAITRASKSCKLVSGRRL